MVALILGYLIVGTLVALNVNLWEQKTVIRSFGDNISEVNPYKAEWLNKLQNSILVTSLLFGLLWLAVIWVVLLGLLANIESVEVHVPKSERKEKLKNHLEQTEVKEELQEWQVSSETLHRLTLG